LNEGVVTNITIALGVISDMTGVRYTYSQRVAAARDLARRSELWATHSEFWKMATEYLVTELKSGKYAFVYLSECISDVRNEDVLDLLPVFCDGYLYENDPRIANLTESAFEDIAWELLILMLYSGYDPGYWTDFIIKTRNRHAAYSSVDNFLKEYSEKHFGRLVIQRDGYTGTVYDLGKVCEISRIVPDFRELVRIVLSTGHVGIEQDLREVSRSYLDICKAHTGFSEETILKLIDNLIPCFLDIRKHTVDEGAVRNERLVKAFKESDNLMQFYNRIFRRNKSLIYRHQKAFDMFVNVMLHPDIVQVLDEYFMRQDIPGEDFSTFATNLIEYTFDWHITDIIYADNVDEAEYLLESDLLALEIFCEGMLDLLNDPVNRRKLLSMPKELSDMFTLLVVTSSLIKDLDVLAQFPADVVAAAIKKMKAEDAYSYIISRGGILL